GRYDLALWCRQRKLDDLADQELRSAIALDPNHAAARRALGHVQIGDAWLEPTPKSATAKNGPTTRPGATMEGARLALRDVDRDMATMLRAEWVKRIRTIRGQYLISSNRPMFQQGAQMLLAIRDPLAVEPMMQLLKDGPAEQRRLLATAIGEFYVSAATMGLLEGAVLDDDETVRKTALGQLSRRTDPRIADYLLKSLQSEDDDVMRNSAAALGYLRVVEAVPALIAELTNKEFRRVRTEPLVQTLRRNFIDEYGQLRMMTIRRTYQDPFAPTYKNVTVTVYRTEVQEALIAITGENFGFDADAWSAWYRRNAAKLAANGNGK
ncbi:MAG: HEAT repeat domain-containing protein, partial [Phycisphaerae bacterium]|nr:HEAT repeat domain-containing protein [Phycisphaerae bacterium]